MASGAARGRRAPDRNGNGDECDNGGGGEMSDAKGDIQMNPALAGLPEGDRTLLIVDDDAPLCQRLARAMERRGFVVATADGVAAGVASATAQPPAFAVVDLRLGDGSGLDVVSAWRGARPGARIIVLTGYGNIATAVAAV